MSKDRLFTPLKVGHNQLQHRVVLAPLTRLRADADNVPTELMKQHYEQRASVPGTLLITEATYISAQASGYPNAPGSWNAQQVAGWKTVTDAVHKKGSFIWLQLWAMGRAANPHYLENRPDGPFKVKAPSAIMMPDGTGDGTPHTVPEALTEEEIQVYIKDYAQAARNAREAGFDGVEIHGANGYLIDEFFQDVTNERTDKYGGSVENRARFGLEVTRAIIDAVGDSKRVAIRLSPWGRFQGMRMADPVPQYTHIVEELKKLDLGYIHFVEERADEAAENPSNDNDDVTQNAPFIKILGKEHPVVLAGAYNGELAKRVTGEVYPDYNVGIAFGRHFISTPDLPFRLQQGLPTNPYDRKSFYGGTEVGYTDYPFSKEFLAQAESRL